MSPSPGRACSRSCPVVWGELVSAALSIFSRISLLEVRRHFLNDNLCFFVSYKLLFSFRICQGIYSLIQTKFWLIVERSQVRPALWILGRTRKMYLSCILSVIMSYKLRPTGFGSKSGSFSHSSNLIPFIKRTCGLCSLWSPLRVVHLLL